MSEHSSGAEKVGGMSLLYNPLVTAIAGAGVASLFTWWLTYSPVEISSATLVGGEISVTIDGDVRRLSNERIIITYIDSSSSKGTSEKSVPIKLNRDDPNSNSFTDKKGLEGRFCDAVVPCPGVDSIISLVVEIERGRDSYTRQEIDWPQNG